MTSDLAARRFRGFLPVVIDVETGGFNARTDALLELAAVPIRIDTEGRLSPGPPLHWHITPFAGARLDPASLEFNGIDPFHPLRSAVPELQALQELFQNVRVAIRAQSCRRGILVGHNAAFDLGFLNAAAERTGLKRNPFHPFSCFDTATLAGVTLGQTVLARAATVAGLAWDGREAHSALYDAERTAELFCDLANRMHGEFLRADERARALGLKDGAAGPLDLGPEE